MSYSLLAVHRVHADGTVDGAWLQDHVGTLQSALEKTKNTSALNSGLQIAVVEKIGFCCLGDVLHYRRQVVPDIGGVNEHKDRALGMCSSIIPSST